MATHQPTNLPPTRSRFRFIDLIVTLTLWLYFIFGFLFFFSFFYLFSYLFARDRQLAFQRLNQLFYRGFFRLAKTIIPQHSWQIDKNLGKTRSSVIVCNHVSYLDPLIIISLFACHKTIVKTKFFHTPIFGWIMKTAGYLPSTTDGTFGYLMIEQMEQMEAYLKEGGNLIVFPQGTRNRDGGVSSFNTGAFKIAKLCQAPIKVLRIQNSDKLFTPGKFLFNTRIRNRISVVSIGTITPDYINNSPSVSELKELVQRCFAAVEP